MRVMILLASQYLLLKKLCRVNSNSSSRLSPLDARCWMRGLGIWFSSRRNFSYSLVRIFKFSERLLNVYSLLEVIRLRSDLREVLKAL